MEQTDKQTLLQLLLKNSKELVICFEYTLILDQNWSAKNDSNNQIHLFVTKSITDNHIVLVKFFYSDICQTQCWKFI